MAGREAMIIEAVKEKKEKNDQAENKDRGLGWK